jgi:hypothetical protein
MSSKSIDRARLAWGNRLPDWIAALAWHCDRASSQGKVAEQLGISSAAVNQVLGNVYGGRLDRVQARVRGELMREVVTCPVLGEISKRDCLDYQYRKFRPTNPARVALFKACKTCPNREGACSK